MSAPFGNYRPGEAGFSVPTPSRRSLLPSRETVHLAFATSLAIASFVLVPATAGMVTFLVIHQVERHCPAPTPLVMRGTLAPERDLASLTVNGSAP